MKIFLWRAVGIVLALAMTTSALAADQYPTRPVRIIVNTGPGGLTDVTTRLVAQKMSEYLKQSVIVENRAGADGLIGIRFVKTAPADGYTLLASAGTIAFQTAFKEDPGYQLQDFTGIGLMARSPFLLVEAPDQPDKTLADFIARAKASPDKLSYASAGAGTGTHLAAVLFVQQTGLNLLHVPYKGNGPAMPDVMSGRVNTIFEAYGSSASYIKGGKLKALGVTSTTRLAAMPEIPTFAEQGVPNYSYYTWLCIVAPAGTPKDVIERLSQALHSATSSKALKDRFREDGMETIAMSPQEFNEFMAREATQVAKLMSNTGLRKQ